MLKKIKKVAIAILIVVNLILIYKLPKLFLNTCSIELPEVKLKQNKTSKTFAIMVSNFPNDIYKEYESEDNTWPGKEYEFKEAKCIDNSGKELENAINYNAKTNIVSLTTDSTVSCTLYFDHKEILEILRENDANKVLSDTEIAGMYRYQGLREQEETDETHKIVDNNYICFGTTDKNECINNEDNYMYRIIGITKDNQMKLIKYKSIGLYPWYADDTKMVDWPDSTAYQILISDKYLENKNYIPNDNWKNLMVNYDWLYGRYNRQISMMNGLEVYKIESGVSEARWADNSSTQHTMIWNQKITSKVSLMYLHDFYLSYDNEFNSYVGVGTAPKKLSWLNSLQSRAWMMSGSDYMNTSDHLGWTAMGFYETSTVMSFDSDTLLNIYPVFYLKSNILLSGSGSIDSPFIINLK